MSCDPLPSWAGLLFSCPETLAKHCGVLRHSQPEASPRALLVFFSCWPWTLTTQHPEEAEDGSEEGDGVCGLRAVCCLTWSPWSTSSQRLSQTLAQKVQLLPGGEEARTALSACRPNQYRGGGTRGFNWEWWTCRFPRIHQTHTGAHW